MKVKEAIVALQKMHPDAEIVIPPSDKHGAFVRLTKINSALHIPAYSLEETAAKDLGEKAPICVVFEGESCSD